MCPKYAAASQQTHEDKSKETKAEVSPGLRIALSRNPLHERVKIGMNRILLEPLNNSNRTS